jgi:hypothetical protein
MGFSDHIVWRRRRLGTSVLRKPQCAEATQGHRDVSHYSNTQTSSFQSLMYTHTYAIDCHQVKRHHIVALVKKSIRFVRLILPTRSLVIEQYSTSLIPKPVTGHNLVSSYGFQVFSLRRGFLATIREEFLVSSVRAACPVHRNLLGFTVQLYT